MKTQTLPYIRNFCIIAHIDHGKSTLADRLLEVTDTIEKRKMRAQVLDRMDLERERGITIKMTPVRMSYGEYVLNLIDTPGHIDFSYEVSRAQKAVEGAVLLVDATQGVQAQTLSVLQMARDAGLVIIPVVNKVDMSLARVPETKDELAKLLDGEPREVIEVSGKTGQGVPELLAEIVHRIPPPATASPQELRALVFDFEYTTHQGIILYIRVFDGSVRRGDTLRFQALGRTFSALEVGVFTPEKQSRDVLVSGEIGYIVTGIKEVVGVSVGDTITPLRSTLGPLPGYGAPRPVVWASLYPESQDDLALLRQSLGRLRLSDAALTYEEEASGALGRGFRCGFLGMLHLEITTERLRREHALSLIVAQPTISYEVEYSGHLSNEHKHTQTDQEESVYTETIYSPALFPDEGTYKRVSEPWLAVTIITPPEQVNNIMPLLHEHEAEVREVELFGDRRNAIYLLMPLRELMRHFFDEIKSVSSGYASLSYTFVESRPADVLRLDVLVAGERVAAFSRVVSRRRLDREAEEVVEKLKKLLPRELFEVRIQAVARGRILASRSIPAMRKDVTGYLYGGDITRKKKLWEKQKRGKKRMQASARVRIPHDIFLKMMKAE